MRQTWFRHVYGMHRNLQFILQFNPVHHGIAKWRIEIVLTDTYTSICTQQKPIYVQCKADTCLCWSIDSCYHCFLYKKQINNNNNSNNGQQNTYYSIRYRSDNLSMEHVRTYVNRKLLHWWRWMCIVESCHKYMWIDSVCFYFGVLLHCTAVSLSRRYSFVRFHKRNDLMYCWFPSKNPN